MLFSLTLLTLLVNPKRSLNNLSIGNYCQCTLKPQSNGPLRSNSVIGTLAVDGWSVTFGIVRMGVGGLKSHPVPTVPSLLYQMLQPIHQWPVYQLHIILWHYNYHCTLKS